MKTFRYFILFNLCIGFSPFLISQWQWQNPLPQGNTLNDVFFIDQNIGWAVGDAGTIMKSVDGGQTYVLTNFQTHKNFKSVEFFDPITGLISGESGIILKTADGGLSWNQVDVGLSANITDMSIINSSIVWISTDDGTIIRSTDYGDTWHPVFSDPSWQFVSLSFVDLNHGWAAGLMDPYNVGMISTNDGGESWTIKELPNEYPILDICLVDSLIGFASFADYEDFNNLAKTADGGETWQFLLNEFFYGEFYDIMFTDHNHGWIAGSSATIPGSWGILLFTDDGGINWYPGENLGYEYLSDFNAVYFINSETGWMVGSLGNTLYTIDGGEHWTRINSGTNSYGSNEDVFFIDENNGWVVGGAYYVGFSRILYTPNGGNSWVEKVAPTDNILNSVYFASLLEGWITTKQSAGGWWSEILHTTDGGNSWEIQHNIDYDQGTFVDIFFTDSNRGWAVGEKGHSYPPPFESLIYKTWNGGDTWVDYSHLASNAIMSVYFTDPQHGWMAGHTTILATANGGQSWEEIWTGPHYLRDIFFTDEQHGWAIGDSATRYPYRDVIMRTTDGGMTWEEQFPGFGSYEKSIFFTDDDHGWIARDEGDILYTVDGGITWDHMFINTNNELGGIWFNDIDHGWVVGGYDAIFHIDNGSIVNVNEGSDNSANPSVDLQLFPNPCKDQATINFSLPESCQVSLKIYDLPGIEIEILVNGRLNQGEHSCNFNTSGFVNGVYLCKLVTGTETAAGKIVVNK